MKTNCLWPIVCMLLWATAASAQTTSPVKEYKLVASSKSISVPRGQQDSLKITIVRSRSFKTGRPSMAVISPREDGLTISIKQLATHPDDFMIYLLATSDAKLGEYNVIPSCTLRNKTKGIIIKLIITK